MNDLENMWSLLRRAANDSGVIQFTGRQPEDIERVAYQGFVNIKPVGISVIFKEAPWVVPLSQGADASALHVAAFHLHREGHEGHSQYQGALLGGVLFGDSEAAVIRKLGQPSATGGGGISTVLKKPIPRWVRYLMNDAIFHFQLDGNGQVEMLTLYAPDFQAKTG
jgi:hypothetical protein